MNYLEPSAQRLAAQRLVADWLQGPFYLKIANCKQPFSAGALASPLQLRVGPRLECKYNYKEYFH